MYFSLLSNVMQVCLEEVQLYCIIVDAPRCKGMTTRMKDCYCQMFDNNLHKTDSCKVTTTILYLTATLVETPQTASFRSHDSRTGVPLGSVLRKPLSSHLLFDSKFWCHYVTVIGEYGIRFDLLSSQPCGR